MAMIEMAQEPEPQPEARLRINIGNEQPISAQEIGRLIRELGTDYKRETGGTLVLERLELGSTFIEVADQAVVYAAYLGVGLIAIEASERMVQFYKFIASQLQGAPKVTGTLPPPLNASPARLLEIAAESGADLEIIKGSGKNKEVIRLTQTEVSMRNSNAKQRKRSMPRNRTLAAPEAPIQIGHLAEGLRAQTAAAPDQMEGLVELFVEFMKSNGNEYQLPALADELESQGLSEIAGIVRRHIRSGPTQRITI